MTISEKVAALANPEYGKQYSSCSAEEILSVWHATQPQDPERYFIYREILASKFSPTIEQQLLSSSPKSHTFLGANEYLIAEYEEGCFGTGGFATSKSFLLYISFLLVVPFALVLGLKLMSFLGGPYMLFWAGSIWLSLIKLLLVLFWGGLWFAWTLNSLTHSHVFVTNQRIGYYRTIFRIFQLPPKWLGLNDGHFISGVQNYFESIFGGLQGISTKKEVLNSVYPWLRLDKYGPKHKHLNINLNLGTSIYLFEIIKLITSETSATIYNAPIVYPSVNGNFSELAINYRFAGSNFEDLQLFFKTINHQSLLLSKNIVYMGQTNMARLATFFASIEEGANPGQQPADPNANSCETVLAYIPGSLRGIWKSPLIALTTTGVKCYTRGGGRLKSQYLWSDPNLAIGASMDSINITYKEKVVIHMYWNIMDIPIVDVLEIVGIKKMCTISYKSLWEVSWLPQF